MARVGIVIEPWKIEIYERRLKAEGYAPVRRGELRPGAVLLTIEADNVDIAAAAVLAAVEDARRIGPPKG